MVIHYSYLVLFLGIISFIVVLAVYPLVLRIARVKKIYDNPDERKLQREPIPLLGGLAIFIGIFFGFTIVLSMWFKWQSLFMLVAIFFLMCIGIWDDRKNLSPTLRFIMEIFIVTGLILVSGNMVDEFGGVFGIYKLNLWIAYPLSVIAGVGIINSINLIDGIDGYSSGYIFMICLIFGLVFLFSHIYALASICFISAGAIMPFYIHNVFGKKTKMYIGDGGTLMLGTLITSLTFSLLRHDSLCYNIAEKHNIGLIAFSLAILSIPVFDTLRVMTQRLINKKSPFYPDKNHLHHLFIDLGFSHVGTTFVILTINILIILAWFVSWLLGGNPTIQLLVVIISGFISTFVLYPYMKVQKRRNTALYNIVHKYAELSHVGNSKFWLWMQKLTDGDLFAAGKY